MELKESDYKILHYIFHNNNQSLTKIAKALKLSRDQIDYKMKKYLEEGVIKKFFPIFNYSAFGYNCFASLFLKFEKSNSAEKFLKILEKNKNTISYGKCSAKYDLWMNTIFKNEKELSDFISNLMSNPETPLSEYLILKPYFSELFPMKFAHSYNPESSYLILGKEQISPRKFDNKEIEIMKMLAKNSWETITNIASKIKSSPELTLYKIRKLEKDGIILGTRTQFDMQKLGYFATIVLINIPNLSETNKNKLKKFAKESKHVDSFSLFLSKPNCFIQIFHKKEIELRKTLEELTELFKNERIEIEMFPIEQELGELDTLPFL
ncbi:Lrp/AsnC family transcriptional regulator [Candidatus Pacearchaeota archaeon]|nr:Lrp/AsnC family transcriptional regulator [Candidatus Pacearchaeota archaeon]